MKFQLFYFLYCADLEIGFDKTEVTVVEGEMVLLNASFKNNVTSKDYAGSGFSVYVYDEENVTGKHALPCKDPRVCDS